MEAQEEKWNLRYVLFAKSQGRTPAEQLAFDREKGHSTMMEYILWNSARINEFREERGLVKQGPWSEPLLPHEEYDKWLALWVERHRG